MKAIVDGEEEYATIAARAGVEPAALVEHDEVMDRAIQLMRGFYKYGHENMKPVGLPPPSNPYLNKGAPIDEQAPEYYAFEAVQRRGLDRDHLLFTCGQLGLSVDLAETAIDNVCMPWRPENGWKTYARELDGKYVLQDKPPVKLKRFLDRFLLQLQAD